MIRLVIDLVFLVELDKIILVKIIIQVEILILIIITTIETLI